MQRHPLICGTIFLATLTFCHQVSQASTISYSVNRGVVVDGTSFSSSAPGLFNVSHSNTNEFGWASASISSIVEDGLISLNGSAEISAASNEEFSPEGRAVVFLDAEISIDQQAEWSLTALLIGDTEAEHWRASVSLTGPQTDIEYSVVDDYLPVEASGVLQPGTYVFSIRAIPEVLGGLDGGSATAYIGGSFLEPNLTFLFNPLSNSTNGVPEPSSIALVSLLSVLGLVSRISLSRR